MNARDISPVDDMHVGFPVARIDAQDESYILPIREYLESNGVEAVVNEPSIAEPLYHIVAGDATYVKHIFSREHGRGVKRLGIILEGGRVAEEFSGKIKLVRAHPTPMTEQEVMRVFEFFFTEGKNHLDIRSHHENRTVHEGAHLQTDDARVKSIIADVFKKETKPRKRIRALMLGALMGVALLVIPMAWYAVSMIVSGATVAAGARALRQGNYAAVSWNTRIADYWVHQGAFVLTMAAVPFSWVGWQDTLRGQQRLVSFMRDAVEVEVKAQALTAVAARVATGLLNQVDATSTGTTPAGDISNLRISLYTLGNTLGLAQAELSMLLTDRTFPFSIDALAKKGKEATGDLATIRQSTSDIDKLLSLFLSLAGFKEPRTYLLLLQNSMELRPTGGFIGSVAIASFADGRLTNLQVEDVYTFDGQLKGHVDPPTPIKELLGQEHWYLRDSNWDPDFKEAGERARWFYEKETGASVDGVIGISTPFIIDILAATGPIELSDYGDRITAENFYGKSIYYTQNDFFPGSTQKKDFLGSLSRTLLTTITSGKSVNTTTLFRALTTALGAHDLVMMFRDPQLQSLIEHYGWAGRAPPDAGCTGTDEASCVFDPIIPVEANVGVNKVNYFVTRTLERNITIHTDGTRTASITTTIKNSSGGKDANAPYRTYIRFVLPSGVSVTGVSVDGVAIASRKGAALPIVPYVETATVASGQNAIGVALDVPSSKERTLVVSYTDPRPLSFGSSGAILDVFTQKQAGITGEKVATTITYPAEWTAGIEEQASTRQVRDFIAKPGQLKYNTTLTRDDLTRIRFTK